MKYILHNIRPDNADYIIAAKAAHSIHKRLDKDQAKQGDIVLLGYEDGSEIQVHVNKRSISAFVRR